MTFVVNGDDTYAVRIYSELRGLKRMAWKFSRSGNGEISAAGVELYKARKWDECIVHFSRMLARNPDDTGAAAYIATCEEKKLFPPDETWAGSLELKEK